MTTRTRDEKQSREHLFELTGGALCLDFINTIERRPSPEPRDLVVSYEALLSWGEQSCLFREGQVDRLRSEARAHRSRARRVLDRAKKLREALFTIFSSLARGEPLAPGPVGVLNEVLPKAMSRLRVAPGETGFKWYWRSDELSLDVVLHPVAESAADLLTSEEVDRVRLCESDQCDWLFLDRSRNRSRRWCDMTVCGNRAKARRHYHRVRKSS